MRPWQVILLLGYCLGMALGQLLFKQAAITLRANAGGDSLVWQVLTNTHLVAAVLLYAALTALWVYILSITELSKAYPFNALPLVLTPLLASRLFDERLNTSFYLGMGAILIGVFLIARGADT